MKWCFYMTSSSCFYGLGWAWLDCSCCSEISPPFFLPWYILNNFSTLTPIIWKLIKSGNLRERHPTTILQRPERRVETLRMSLVGTSSSPFSSDIIHHWSFLRWWTGIWNIAITYDDDIYIKRANHISPIDYSLLTLIFYYVKFYLKYKNNYIIYHLINNK